MSPVDFKKSDKVLYSPGTEPSLVDVPAMRFLMIDGKGDPNEEGGEYQMAVGILYGLAYGIKMRKTGGKVPDGYFEYVVPPLEGLWWMSDGSMDFTKKEKFQWTSMIRQPDFVTEEVFRDVCADLLRKKKIDASAARLVIWEEGLCVQIMHMGTYDREAESVARISSYVEGSGELTYDFSDARRHHEIYLSDPRKTEPENRKTIIRHPVRRMP